MLDRARPDWKALTRHQRLEAVEPYRQRGLGGQQIANQFLNCSRNSVIGALNRAGLELLSTSHRRRPNGNKGQPKAPVIRHNIATRDMELSYDRRYAASAVWEPLEGTKPISMMELPDRRFAVCRWPVTGGYCGQPSGERTYCDHHHAIAYKGGVQGNG